MKFGSLPSIQGVDFSLPAPNPRSLSQLGRKAAPSFDAYVGLSRWSSTDWIGHLYPKGTSPSEYLSWYSKAYNTIELNTTHYRIPSIEQVEKWKGAAQPGFRFCPKIPQIISHARKLIHVRIETRQFLESVAHFQEKMGCCFLQLHESFSPSLMSNLRQFLDQWSAHIPLAIEFRHPGWFVNQTLSPEIMDLLEGRRISTVITDVAGRRDVAHTSLSGTTAMIRLVGNQLNPSDYTRSDAWLERIRLWIDHGLETLYVFPHQPSDRMASDLGDYLINTLNETSRQQISGSNGINLGGQLNLF